MNNQDERSDFSEDELKDPTNKRIMAALHHIYHIDEDDRRSVEHAWQHISASMDQEQKQHVSPLHGRHTNLAYFSLTDTRNTTDIQRSSMRRRLDTLVALGIVFLLIGSMLGALVYHQAMSSNLAGKGTSTSTQNSNTPGTHKRLGISLGDLSLNMTPSVLAKQGISGSFFTGTKSNSLIFQCLNSNCWITFIEDPSVKTTQQKPSSDDAKAVKTTQQKPSSDDAKAVQIVIGRGVQGTTLEGFKPGMSLSTFNGIYKETQFQKTSFPIAKFSQQCPLYVTLTNPGTIVAVKDTYGTMLWAVFNQNQQAIQIVLQSSAISPYCNL